jgi:MFS family permease
MARKIDNFTLHTAEGVLYLTGISFVSYETVMPKIVESLGGSPMMIALTPVLFLFTSALPTVFMAGWADRVPYKLPILVPVCILQRAAFLLVALIAWFCADESTIVHSILLAVIWMGILTGIIAPFWNSMCGNTVPPRYIPKLFAIRFGLASLFGILVGFMIKYILQWFPGRAGFGILFFISGVLIMTAVYFMARIREPQAVAGTKRSLMPAPGYREVLLNKDIINFTIARIFFGATYISIAFIPVKICHDLELSDSWLGIFTIMVVVGAVTGNFFTIYWSSRFPLKQAQIIALVCYMVTFILTIFCRNILVAMFIFFLFGFGKDCWNSVASSMIINLPGKRLRAKGSALMSIAMAPPLLLCGMIGAWLFEWTGTYVVPLLASALLMLPGIYFSNRVNR